MSADANPAAAPKNAGAIATLVRLLRYSSASKERIGAALFVAVVGVALELSRPFPIKFVIDHGLFERPLGSRMHRIFDPLPGPISPDWIIAWSVIAAIVISVGTALAAVLTVRLILRSAFQTVTSLASETFDKLQSLSLSFHQKHPVGDTLQRATADVFVAQSLVSAVIIPSIVSLVTLAGMFAVMARINMTLTLVAMIVIPMQAIAFASFVRGLNRTSEQQWKAQGKTMALVENLLGAIKAVQGFGAERYFSKRVRESANSLGEAYYSSAIWGTGYQQAVGASTGIATAIMLGIGAVRVRNGSLSLGDLFVFITYLGALYGPVRELAQAVGGAVQVNARARRVFAVLDSDELVPEAPDALPLGRVRGEVEFQSVSFGYDREKGPILEDISFHVAPGEVVAIVGMSGAGKTSLVSLLSRFADPWSGEILIDGVNVRDVTLASLRHNVGLVLQDPYLLPVTVSDNIAFGLGYLTQERIVQAAEAAQAAPFIERLPKGYDTVIGERGVSLSGGERQRLSIARALAANTPILVLDEPTSSLDAHTEALIFSALDAVMRGRTVFIISHRLSTVRRADKIFTVDGGRIVEVGSHESLMAAGAVYASLYQKQHLEAS